MKKKQILYSETGRGSRKLAVAESKLRGHPFRVLYSGSAIQSALFTETKLRGRLLFPYMKCFDMAYSIRRSARLTLLIGGGGFAYPQHFFRKYPGRFMDVLENSRAVLDTARRFFYLDELESAANGIGDNKQGLQTHSRSASENHLNAILSDGKTYLSSCLTQYDVIINDAFLGFRPEASLRTRSGIRLIKQALKKNGIYVLNIPSAARGPLALAYIIEMRLLQLEFHYTLMVPADERRNPYLPQNCLLFASDAPLIMH